MQRACTKPDLLALLQLERVISSYAALLRVLERSGVPVPRYLPESDNKIQGTPFICSCHFAADPLPLCLP